MNLLIFLLVLAFGSCFRRNDGHYFPLVEPPEPSITREEFTTMIEKMLAYLNKMHDRHSNITEEEAVEIGKVAGNYNKTDEERRPALDALLLKLEGTTENEAEMKSTRLVEYFNNYRTVFQKLKLNGSELWAQLSALPFSTNWTAMNYYERKQKIQKTILTVGQSHSDSTKEMLKIFYYFQRVPVNILEEDKEMLLERLYPHINRATLITEATNQTQKEYFRKVFHIAADYDRHSSNCQLDLAEMLEKDYGLEHYDATQFAIAFTDMAEDFKELLDKMGLYAVDVFQQAYDLVFEEKFRKEKDEEAKKKMLWNHIRQKRPPVSWGHQESVAAIIFKYGNETITETTTLRIIDGEVVENSTTVTIS